ncbi:MAG: STAS domain-containing protein [Prevotella sp.]|nr:STAS domain-containing protein [Prevotella sp.]
MKTTIEQLEDKFLVTLEGELDTTAAAEVSQTLEPLYSTNGLDVVIDCEKLEYIASSGLRILISILKGAKAGGSKVVLKHLSDDIKEVFKLTGFINLFEIEE